MLIKRWTTHEALCQSFPSATAFVRVYNLNSSISVPHAVCNPLAPHPRIIIKNYSSQCLFREALIFSKTTSPSLLRIALLLLLSLHLPPFAQLFSQIVKTSFPPIHNNHIWLIYSFHVRFIFCLHLHIWCLKTKQGALLIYNSSFFAFFFIYAHSFIILAKSVVMNQTSNPAKRWNCTNKFCLRSIIR